MFTFFLIVHALIAAALVTIILMQRSEGGGLGMGGSPSGLMSARGAADFLTRATTILATLFVLMSIGLAALATVQRAPRKIDASLARPTPAAPLGVPAAAPGAVPFEGDPIAGAAGAVAPSAPALPPVATAPAATPRTEAATPRPATVPRVRESAPTPRATAPVTATPPGVVVPAPTTPAPAAETPPPAAGNGATPQ